MKPHRHEFARTPSRGSRILWLLSSALLIGTSARAEAETYTLDSFQLAGDREVYFPLGSKTFRDINPGNQGSYAIDSIAQTLTINRVATFQMTVEYLFQPPILAEAFADQYFLRVPVLSVPDNASILIAVDYESVAQNGVLGSGGAAISYEPRSGDILVADLTRALGQINPPPQSYDVRGFRVLKILIPSDIGVPGAYVFGPITLEGPHFVPEPSTLWLVFSGVVAHRFSAIRPRARHRI